MTFEKNMEHAFSFTYWVVAVSFSAAFIAVGIKLFF